MNKQLLFCGDRRRILSVKHTWKLLLCLPQKFQSVEVIEWLFILYVSIHWLVHVCSVLYCIVCIFFMLSFLLVLEDTHRHLVGIPSLMPWCTTPKCSTLPTRVRPPLRHQQYFSTAHPIVWQWPQSPPPPKWHTNWQSFVFWSMSWGPC